MFEWIQRYSIGNICTNCTLHKSIRSLLRLTWKQSCLHKSDTRCKSIPPSFCLLLQPIRHQKPLLLLLSPTHMYLPTYLLELCPKVIMWVNQGGNRSTLLLIYSSASGIPFLKSMYLEVQTWTTQQLSSHPIIILPTHPAFCPTVGWNTEKLCHLWIFSWN